MIEILNKYKGSGHLMNQTHPNLPIAIWNYTNQTQYEGFWNDITLSARGLVTDNKGNIINNPIPKFFNYSEEKGKEVCEFNNRHKIYKKYDGSLIMVFYYEDRLVVCSRGSFYSHQAIWAMEIIESKNMRFEKGLTYCFELIHPDNRIVCDYGSKEDLILLAVRENGGIELDLSAFDNDFNTAEMVDIHIEDYNDLNNISSENIDDEEGYVFLFQSGGRCKLKFDEYKRLHAIVTNTSSYDIWKIMKGRGNINEILDTVPDEFMSFVKDQLSEINNSYIELKREIYSEFIKLCDVMISSDRKVIAKEIFSTCNYPHQVLSLMDGKSIEDWVWDQCKPKYKKPYSK